MHVLDETMENLIMWVKSLPLGDDTDSWVHHSPNVTVARRCLIFDRMEYCRGLLDYDKMVEKGTLAQRKYSRPGYVPPKKTIEKQRVFEFLVSYFGKECNGRTSNATDMFSCISNLTTKLSDDNSRNKQNDKRNQDHDLDVVIDDINHLIHEETQQDDSNLNDDISTSSTESSDSVDEVTHINNIAITHHKYCTLNAIKLGREEMQKKNDVVIRKLEKERMSRNKKFVHALYKSMSNEKDINTTQIQWLKDNKSCTTDNNQNGNLSFSILFRSLKKKA